MEMFREAIVLLHTHVVITKMTSDFVAISIHAYHKSAWGEGVHHGGLDWMLG